MVLAVFLGNRFRHSCLRYCICTTAMFISFLVHLDIGCVFGAREARYIRSFFF
jgi:hypothetical protein